MRAAGLKDISLIRIGRQMANILGVPQDMELVCFLPVGKAAESVKPQVKKPFEERAGRNGFGVKWNDQ